MTVGDFPTPKTVEYHPTTGYTIPQFTHVYTEGVKFDQGKPRLDLLAPELLDGVGTILGFGAKKYGDRNWELGMKWGRPFSACLRHLWAWWKGEKLDKESGYPHLWHAACNIMFLIAYEERNVGEDDRKT